MDIKLVRKANEGFVNYHQAHLDYDNIHGCYCFIDKVIKDGLIYRDSYKRKAISLGLKNRIDDTEHILFVNDDTLVYARNFKLGPYTINKYGVTLIKEKASDKAPLNYFILLPLKDVVERLKYYESHLTKCLDCDYSIDGVSEYEVYEVILDINRTIQ